MPEVPTTNIIEETPAPTVAPTPVKTIDDTRALKRTIASHERTIHTQELEIKRLLDLVDEKDKALAETKGDVTTAKALKTVVVSNTMAQLEVLLKQLNLEMRRD